MKIHEYQAKALLARYAVPVPRGKVAFTADEAASSLAEIAKLHAELIFGRPGLAVMGASRDVAKRFETRQDFFDRHAKRVAVERRG